MVVLRQPAVLPAPTVSVAGFAPAGWSPHRELSSCGPENTHLRVLGAEAGRFDEFRAGGGDVHSAGERSRSHVQVVLQAASFRRPDLEQCPEEELLRFGADSAHALQLGQSQLDLVVTRDVRCR